MSRKKKICGIGHSMIDYIVFVREEQVEGASVEKGCFAEVEQNALSQMLAELDIASRSPGGSVANMLAGLALLGFDCNFYTHIGNDEHGKFLLRALCDVGVTPFYKSCSGTTCFNITLITPDYERSFLISYGASELSEPDRSKLEQALSGSDIVITTAYEWARTPAIVEYAASEAKKYGAMFVFDLASPSIVRSNDSLNNFVKENVDILFGNEKEAALLPYFYDAKIAVLKLGKGGARAYVNRDGKRHEFYAGALDVSVVSTNGAGDSFSAGFLAAYLLGKDISDCLRFGNFYASHILSKEGAWPTLQLDPGEWFESKA